MNLKARTHEPQVTRLPLFQGELTKNFEAKLKSQIGEAQLTKGDAEIRLRIWLFCQTELILKPSEKYPYQFDLFSNPSPIDEDLDTKRLHLVGAGEWLGHVIVVKLFFFDLMLFIQVNDPQASFSALSPLPLATANAAS